MASSDPSNNTATYQLNDGYSIQTVLDSHRITIELNYSQIPSFLGRVSFDDNQCSMLTRGLCESPSELYGLLDDLLLVPKSPRTSVDLMAGAHLEISFPILFGRRDRTKIWSFSIDFPVTLSLENTESEEISLDPLDWTETKWLGHQIMDDMLDYLKDVRLRPAWRPMPSSVKEAFRPCNFPAQGQSPWEVYQEVRSLILPYPMGNIHPQYWGYVQGTGSVIGALAELITGTMNTMASGGHQASSYVERQVLSWLKMLMGFPHDETSSGALVSGTSVATIIAFAVARQKFHGRHMKVYCSTEVHCCITRAIDLLGIGRENLIFIPTNTRRQIDLEVLVATLSPSACGIIVGTAGTVGTGAIDDLVGLADLCARYPDNLWFHVDGAIGAVARCSTRLRSLFAGLERADSIAFDLHKWLFVPYECGCVIVRDGELHKSTFDRSTPSYSALMDGGITPDQGELYFSDYGLELSRSMKALKAWMTIKSYGFETFGRIMEQNVDQAQYFSMLIQKHPTELELLAMCSLNIVCFRYVINRLSHVSSQTLNKFNQRLLITIQERGIGVVSPYIVGNEIFALRMCITNHRTKRSDLDIFLEKLIVVAHEILKTPEYCL